MGMFGTPIKVKPRAFRGGIRYSKIGKKIKAIPKSLLGRAGKKSLYDTIAKRKQGGLTRYETQGVIRELIDNKHDRISRPKAIRLKKQIEQITGYDHLDYSNEMAFRYGSVDDKGRIVDRTKQELADRKQSAEKKSSISADKQPKNTSAVNNQLNQTSSATRSSKSVGFFDFFTKSKRPVSDEIAPDTQAVQSAKPTERPANGSSQPRSALSSFLMESAAPHTAQSRDDIAQNKLSNKDLEMTAENPKETPVTSAMKIPDTYAASSPSPQIVNDPNPQLATKGDLGITARASQEIPSQPEEVKPEEQDNKQAPVEKNNPEAITLAAPIEEGGDTVDPGRDVSQTEAGFYVKQRTPFTNTPNSHSMDEQNNPVHKALAVVSILVSDRQQKAALVNEILTEYGHLCVGRMGLPLSRNCTSKCASLIVFAVEASQEELNGFLEKFTPLEGVVAKAIVMPGLAGDPAQAKTEFHGIK